MAEIRQINPGEETRRIGVNDKLDRGEPVVA
jgi:hypothetical protein